MNLKINQQQLHNPKNKEKKRIEKKEQCHRVKWDSNKNINKKNAYTKNIEMSKRALNELMR